MRILKNIILKTFPPVKKKKKKLPPTLCLMEALELCLKCNDSIFNQ